MTGRPKLSDDDAVILDLDGTLTVDDKQIAYPDKPANGATLAAAHAARECGYRVVVATSRNMRTYRGDLEQIRRHTQPVIEDWLAREGLVPDALAIGKAWCGPRGFYVDDRNMHVEEFVFRFRGPYAACNVDVLLMPPAEDLHALAAAHARHRKLERLFHIARYIYPRAQVDTALPCELRDDACIEWVSTDEDNSFAGRLDRLTQSAQADWLLIVAGRRPIDPRPVVLIHQRALASLSGPTTAAGWSPQHGVEWLLAPRVAIRQACALQAKETTSLADLAAGLAYTTIEWLLDPSGADVRPPWAQPGNDRTRTLSAG